MKKFGNVASISAFALVAMAPQMAYSQITQLDIDNAIDTAVASGGRVDTAIATAITAEEGARDAAIATAIGDEVIARDAAINNAIDTAVASGGRVDTAIATAITAEEGARDAAIATAIGDEVIARDAAIATAIGQEVIDRNIRIDATVQAASEAEAAARTAAILVETNAREEADDAQNARMDGIDARDTAQETRMDAIDARDTAQETRMDAIDARDTAQETRMDGIDARDTAQETRMDGIDARDTAQETRMDGIDNTVEALGNSAANALGGGATYNASTGQISAPTYSIQGTTHNDVGSALDAIDRTLTDHGNRLNNLDTKVFNLQQQQDLQNRQASGGIAAAMALGGAMIVPDSTVSVNFNIATYRGEQGFAGNLTFRASERVYFNGGVVGSTVRGSTGGRVGVAFGF